MTRYYGLRKELEQPGNEQKLEDALQTLDKLQLDIIRNGGVETYGTLTETLNTLQTAQLFEKLEVQLDIQWDYLAKTDDRLYDLRLSAELPRHGLDHQREQDGLSPQTGQFSGGCLTAAENASKAKTDFLSNMSHDIRTPMNAIIGITTLMENELNDPEILREHLAKLESSGHHLLSIINDILDMSRIESGKTTLNVTSMNLADQVTQIDSILRPQADERNQTLDVVTTHLKHENVMGDPTRLNQVLVNILSNSIKYTPEGGHILFEIEELPRNGHYARYQFIVEDDGVGMSKEFVKRLYDPFTRAENSVTNKVQGTGLGMAITKSIVDLMNGIIHVDSTPWTARRARIPGLRSRWNFPSTKTWTPRFLS